MYAWTIPCINIHGGAETRNRLHKTPIVRSMQMTVKIHVYLSFTLVLLKTHKCRNVQRHQHPWKLARVSSHTCWVSYCCQMLERSDCYVSTLTNMAQAERQLKRCTAIQIMSMPQPIAGSNHWKYPAVGTAESRKCSWDTAKPCYASLHDGFKPPPCLHVFSQSNVSTDVEQSPCVVSCQHTSCV